MRSFKPEECEGSDLERWENEGGRIYKLGSERNSPRRDPRTRRMNKDSLQRVSFLSVLHRVDGRVPPSA